LALLFDFSIPGGRGSHVAQKRSAFTCRFLVFLVHSIIIGVIIIINVAIARLWR
jgi:hypothetical protein